MKQASADQCIVLPFRPEIPQQFNGVGLALHFLVGNVLVLHTGFKEMWFGWRVKNIFPTRPLFQRYCREIDAPLDLVQSARSQKIRFWIHGSYKDHSASLYFFDNNVADSNKPPLQLTVSLTDNLIGFREQLLRWLAFMDYRMPQDQHRAALWPEKIDREGLDAVGRSLENVYLYSYGGEGPLDMASFKKAVAMAPKSFMAQDLYGWALYRNRRYKAAHDAFLSSLAINPAGAGAMSGLMWCGVYMKDLEEAMFWSGRKADVCGKDIEAARAAGRRKYEKANKGNINQ